MRKIKPVPDYPGYFAAADGRVYSRKTGKIREIALQTDKFGYRAVGLFHQGKKVYRKAHTLVALAWIDNPDKKPIINHRDGNPANNNIGNLEWCTYKENSVHARDVLGRQFNRHGEANSSAKLSAKEVAEIKRLKGQISQYKIANMFGVTQSHISRIFSNETRARG